MMKKKITWQSVLLTIFILIAALVALFPVYFLIVASLQPTQYMSVSYTHLNEKTY